MEKRQRQYCATKKSDGCHPDRFSDREEMEDGGYGGQESEPNLMASSKVNQSINPCVHVPSQGLAWSPANV